MTRRRRDHAEPVADFGAQPWLAEVEDAPDPDRPNATIRRARRYDPLRRMEDLDHALFAAAERFRDRYALAEGAREQAGSARLEPWQRCHYADRVADARAEVRGSLQAVGLRLSAVFVGAVVQYERLRDVERELGMRSGTASALVVEALEKLRDYQTEVG